MVQLVPGTVTVQVPPPGEAVTVYEEGVPPVVGATTVIVADPLPGVAIGVPGIPGAAILHCAIKVLFPVTLVTDVDGSITVAPSLQPLKVKPFRLGAVGVVKESPCKTFGCVGVAPAPPFNR